MGASRSGSAVDPSVVRVVWGTGTAPTAIASYDAALAEAGVHNYNLSSVSSIVPPDASVEAVGTAPDLGPVGSRLTVVEARALADGPGRATAGLGWTTGDGPGLFYEVAGAFDEAEARDGIERGLDACLARRDWDVDDREIRTVTGTNNDEGYLTALVLAVYGTGEPIL